MRQTTLIDTRGTSSPANQTTAQPAPSQRRRAELDKERRAREEAEKAGGDSSGSGRRRQPTTNELRNDSDEEIRSAEDGKHFLEKYLLTISGESYTLSGMATTLLHINQMKGVGLPIKNAIRAVSFILDDLDADDKANIIAGSVTSQLQKEMKNVTTSITETMKKATDELSAQIASTTTKALHEIRTAATSLTSTSTELNATAEALRKVKTASPSTTPPDNVDERAEARELIRARQILVDIEHEGGKHPLPELSQAALIDKANDAISTMEGSDGFVFVGVDRLSNGGIVYEMNNEKATEWIREEKNATTFGQLLDETAQIIPRSFPLVVPFVPLTFNPDNEADLREVEETNQLPGGSIKRARYVKPADRRRPDQRMGHVIFVFSNAKVANKVIKEGLIVCHKRLTRVEKCKKEPIRCLKCQGYGHIAAQCIFEHDICGTCAEHHRTANCTRQNHPYCTACDTEGHASWSRDCPVFTEKCLAMDRRHRENLMPYFPTEESWTRRLTPMAQMPPPPRSVPLDDFVVPNRRGSQRVRRRASPTPTTGHNNTQRRIDDYRAVIYQNRYNLPGGNDLDGPPLTGRNDA